MYADFLPEQLAQEAVEYSEIGFLPQQPLHSPVEADNLVSVVYHDFILFLQIY